jgi:hypothetical protein
MRRRDLLLGVASGACVQRTFSAWSQATVQRSRIGVLLEYAEGDFEAQSRLRAFAEGLRSHGLEEGRNLHIEYRFAAGDGQGWDVLEKRVWARLSERAIVASYSVSRSFWTAAI